ncbi:MAG: hypothetical protein RL318_16 [Fibrobacterota bacterium]|jgi:hypothetical protein
MKFRTFALLSSLLPLAAAAAPIPGVASHWLANTSGTSEGHIANFLTDMVVYYPAQGSNASGPLAITASFWDEGNCGYCGYKDGASIGKAEWWRDTIHSDRAWYGGKKCTIGNLWGRAFLFRNSAPPKGDSAPYVACTGHDTLRSVTDPTALAFDRSGNLLVADNGPDQNVKIFAMDAPKPRLLRTFGDSGGVFAGPVSGRAGTRRFWGIRGLGVDSTGNVYVGNTGIPMQTMGGTDIRVFSGKDSSLLWQVQGLSFVNSADADPASDAKSVFLNAKRFEMDWSQAPGRSWKLAATTLDPFRYPSDPRIVQPMESVFLRRIQGKLFQFSTSMTGDFLAIHRFVEGSEIAVPAGFICLRDAKVAWMADSAPAFERNEANKRVRWAWMDRNGDGIPQKSEYALYDNFNIYSQSLEVGEDGALWTGGQGDWSVQFQGGGLVGYGLDSLDKWGVPHWNLSKPNHVDVPFPADSGFVGRMKYLTGSDVMYLGVQRNYFLRKVLRYEHWSDPARRNLSATIDLGYDDKGEAEIRLDQNSAAMTLPMSFTADSDYVYTAYLDNGRDARVRGEISVQEARSGRMVGWIVPGAEVGFRAGAVDLLYGVNVRTQADGHKVVFVEEDGFGKVMAYRWCPVGAKCSEAVGVEAQQASQGLATRHRVDGWEVRVPVGSMLDVRDLRGALIRAVHGNDWVRLGALAKGVYLAQLRGGQSSGQAVRIVVP